MIAHGHQCLTEQVSAATASSAVAFAASVANASRALRFISQGARTSLVSTLSSTIHAGFLHTQANDRHGYSTVDRATEISDVLRAVHLSTLENLYPGEDPISTQSEFLSLGSQKTSCGAHSCASVVVSPPALSNEDPSSSSFTLSSEALSEIVAGLNTGFERETTELLGHPDRRMGHEPLGVAFGPVVTRRWNYVSVDGQCKRV